MKIVYIGPKDLKIDKISGSRMVFPRFEALEVDKEHALVLLRYKDVYVEEKDLSAAIAKIEAKDELILKEKKAVQENVAVQQKLVSREIIMNGKKVDLRKYTAAKLSTFVEGNGLDVAPKNVSESVQDYCDRVFDGFVKH